MKIRTSILASWLSFIGALLILINVLAIMANRSAILISSKPVSSIEEILSPESGPWYRITFGIRYLTEGPSILVYLFFGVVILHLAASAILTHERPKANPLISLLSIISILAGGGFVIGTVLAVTGNMMLHQWRKPIGNTFIGKLLRVLRLDPKVFRMINQEKYMLHEAVLVILLVGFLSGLGLSIYLYNVNAILHSAENAIKVLLLGDIFFDVTVLNLPIINVSLMLLKWLFLSLIIYIIGSRIIGYEEARLNDVARLTGYAHVPIGLQLFFPLVFSNEPTLTIYWPLTITIITELWTIFALIVATKECFEITITKALGIMMLTWPIYWILFYEFMLPVIFGPRVPGVHLNINPIEITMIFTSFLFFLSFLLGTFKK